MRQQNNNSQENKSLSSIAKATLALAAAGLITGYGVYTIQSQRSYEAKNNCEIEREQVEQEKMFIPTSSNEDEIEGLYMNEDDFEDIAYTFTYMSQLQSTRDSLVQEYQNDQADIRETIQQFDSDNIEAYKNIVSIDTISAESYEPLARRENGGWLLSEDEELSRRLAEETGIAQENQNVSNNEFYDVSKVRAEHRRLYMALKRQKDVERTVKGLVSQSREHLTTMDPDGYFIRLENDDFTQVHELTFTRTDNNSYEGIPDDAKNCSLGSVDEQKAVAYREGLENFVDAEYERNKTIFHRGYEDTKRVIDIDRRYAY